MKHLKCIRRGTWRTLLTAGLLILSEKALANKVRTCQIHSRETLTAAGQLPLPVGSPMTRFTYLESAGNSYAPGSSFVLRHVRYSVMRLWLAGASRFTVTQGYRERVQGRVDQNGQVHFEIEADDGDLFQIASMFTAPNNTVFGADLRMEDEANAGVKRCAVNDPDPVSCQPVIQGNSRCFFAPDQDFDGNGVSDVALQNSQGAVSIWYLNKAGQVTPKSISAGIGQDWKIEGNGDFNGDGLSDLVLRHTSGAIYAYMMKGDGSVTSLALGMAPMEWQIVGISDFNRDGVSDLLFRDNNGILAVFHSQAANALMYNRLPINLLAGIVGYLSPDWKIEHIADLNDDGVSDILFRHQNGSIAAWNLGINFVNEQMGMSSVQYMSSSSIGVVGLDWKILGATDLNSDNYADLVFQHDNGTLLSWKLDSNSQFTSAQSYGALRADLRVKGIADGILTGDRIGYANAQLLVRSEVDGSIQRLQLDESGTYQLKSIAGPLSSEWKILP